MADCIAILGTLGGVLIGGGLALGKDWLLSSKKEKEDERKRNRDKLEELHQSALEYNSACDELAGKIAEIYVLEESREKSFFVIRAQLQEISLVGNKVKSLQRLYAPELENECRSLLRAVLPMYKLWQPIVEGKEPMSKLGAWNAEVLRTVESFLGKVQERLEGIKNSTSGTKMF